MPHRLSKKKYLVNFRWLFMDKQQTIQILSKHLDEIQKRFFVERLSIFWSVARDEAGPDSDLDVLVVFAKTPGLFTFLELKDYLEDTVKRPVDLVTEAALKKTIAAQNFAWGSACLLGVCRTFRIVTRSRLIETRYSIVWEQIAVAICRKGSEIWADQMVSQ